MVGKRKEIEEDDSDGEIESSQTSTSTTTTAQRRTAPKPVATTPNKRTKRVVVSESESESDQEMSDDEFENSQPTNNNNGNGNGKSNGNGNGHANGNGHHTNGNGMKGNGHANGNGVAMNGKKKAQQSILSSQEEDDEDDDESQGQDNDDDDVGEESELGIIESISVENFMCHRHFEIKFGSRVNFISGENGSGKSALLVALIVCLGAKSGTTNRGHKLADLVKNGANQAVITVKLRNKGLEAYQPTEYGPSIIIERRISKSGSSNGYKLKDHTGKKTISTKFADLAVILELFNIQIENPMAILMQDTSREFLNTSRPQDKYNFFLTATQLDQMSKDYHFIDDQLKMSNAELEKKNLVIGEMQKKVADLSKEYKELQLVVDLEDQMQNCKEQLAWAYVVGVENVIAHKTEELKTLTARRDTMSKESTTVGQRIQQMEAQIAAQRMEIAGIHQNRVVFDNQMKEVERQITEVAREETHSVSQMNDRNKRLEALTSRRRNQDRQIKDTKKRNEQMRRNQSKQGDVDGVRDKLRQTEQSVHEIVHNRDESKKEFEHIQQIVQQTQRATADATQAIAKVEKQLETLRAARGDNVRMYGDRMPLLIRKIQDNARRFSMTPIGPIGIHIKLTDDRWAYAVEQAIKKGVLYNFLVNSFDDGKVFKQLARECGLPEVEFNIISLNRPIYPELLNLDSQIQQMTVYRAITCDVPAVANFLVDNRKIESLGLARDIDEAKDWIFKRKAHREVKEAYTPSGDRIFSNANRTAQNVTSGNRAGRAQFLRANMEQAIRDTEQQIQQMRPDLDRCKRDEKDANSKMQAVRSVLQRHEGELSKTNQLLFRLRADLKNLEEQLIEPTDEPTEELEQGLEQMDREIGEMQVKIRELDGERKAITAKKDPFHRQIREIQGKIDDHDGQVRKVETEIGKITRAERELRNQDGKFITEVTKIDQNVTRLQHELTNDNLLLKAQEAKAQEFCDRVDVGPRDTPESLSGKIAALTRNIEKESRGKRSRAEVFSLFKESQSKLTEIIEYSENMNKFNTKLSIHLRSRFINWQKLRNKIAKRTAQYFNIFLSRKGYSGSIEFDHSNKKLDVNVQLDKMRPSSNVSGGKGDTKTLSGGERSFSTVSLLLSFWEAMECPFRAMDEFDVFMDEVNRRISIDLLLSKAKENANRQFIFVSPLSLNAITPSPFIYIHKVRPPIRGQRTITETLNS